MSQDDRTSEPWPEQPPTDQAADIEGLDFTLGEAPDEERISGGIGPPEPTPPPLPAKQSETCEDSRSVSSPANKKTQDAEEGFLARNFIFFVVLAAAIMFFVWLILVPN